MADGGRSNMLTRDPADPLGRRRHGRARIRAHRQHHLGHGEDAQCPALGLSVGGPARPDRLCQIDRPRIAPIDNVTINNLLPERFDTDRLRSNIARLSGSSDKPIDELLAAQAKASTAGRFGRVEEFGAVCAFYCSVHAGFLTGQNVMLDGGAYPGVF